VVHLQREVTIIISLNMMMLMQVYNFYLLALQDPGYYVEDVTGNGFAEYDDLVLVYNNYIAGIYSHNPLNPVLNTRPLRNNEIDIKPDEQKIIVIKELMINPQFSGASAPFFVNNYSTARF